MTKSKTITTVIIIIVALIAVYWAYNQFFDGSEVEPAGVTVTTGTVAPADNSTASQLVRVLSDVDKTTLNNRSIFSNSIFKDQLRDFGKIIADRPLGRSNPFAPIGAGVAAVSNQPAGGTTGGAATGGTGADTDTGTGTAGDGETGGGDGGGDARLDIFGE